MKYFVEPVGPNSATLAAYIPDVSVEMETASKRGAVLIMPGGGYSMCSDREAEPIALAYLAKGYAAFVLRYTVGGGKRDIPAKALADAEAALQKIRDNSDEWNLIPGKVAAVGFSAGGHVAASLGTISRNKPDALILGYPLVENAMLELLQMDAPSIEEHITNATPPTFIFHTRGDQVVPIKNTLILMDAFEEVGVQFEAHIFRDGPHGLSLAVPQTANGQSRGVNPAVATWFDMSVEWLRGLWGDFPVDDAEVEEKIQHLSLMTAPISELEKHEAMWSEILGEIPMLEAVLAQNEVVKNLSFEQILAYAPDVVSPEVIKRLQEKYPD